MRAPTPTVRNARTLRRQITPPETRLWVRLRTRIAGRPVFRRQYPVGPYVLDFYCPAAKLCVEVDGWRHNMGDQPERDERRDSWLAGQGIETLRIEAVEVLKRPDDVAAMVVDTANARLVSAGSSAT